MISFNYPEGYEVVTKRRAGTARTEACGAGSGGAYSMRIC